MGLGQNGVVLSFFEPKRRRFGSAIIFFFEILSILKRRRFGQNWSKTASFWSRFHIPKTTSFGLVIAASKRRRFGPVYTKTTSFCYVFKNKKMKRRRFISSIDKPTSFRQPPCPNRGIYSSFQFAAGERGGRQGRLTGCRSFGSKSSHDFGAGGGG